MANKLQGIAYWNVFEKEIELSRESLSSKVGEQNEGNGEVQQRKGAAGRVQVAKDRL